MNIHNKNIVITGAANGIGYALAKRIIQESPKSISLIDISSSVNEVARSMNADSYVVDVSNENDFQSVLNSIIDKIIRLIYSAQMLAYSNLEHWKLQQVIGKKIGMLMLCPTFMLLRY